ncbi:hypothetical protein L228DRAFT_237247 [Xylona heveae TC161]|uniref:D-isomer specific 2-hydroxyacid dehydrogenase NAD-binding domain-containing protein n=1 Tax=Xylona heveae (strain CBS 132557 / TC161) TaxID=1328760 RepID=A0A165I346_XYLHT|nr:hypothetical protein L228DRAFT_237247 [Xylona heveae TC161]KZF24305.1 hypothetical protein L228DRAFT_237247 [Xylona heveae TC161]
MAPLENLTHLLAIVPFAEPKGSLDQIREKNPGVKITWIEVKLHPLEAWQNDVHIDPEVYRDVDVLMTLRALPEPGQAPRLRYVHVFAAGTNHITSSPLYQKSDIFITSSSGCHGPQIAEWVMMTALAQTHRLRTLYQWQDQCKWGRFDDHFWRVRDLVGQRLGVLGYGSIGRQAARVAKAFGMDVIAYTASPKTTPESKKDQAYTVPGTGDPNGELPSAWYSGLDKASLHNFLAQGIDILLLSLPATPQTYHMIGEEELDILGRTNHTFISNVGRGELIDHEALARVMKKRPGDEVWLRGAALDVAEPEPLPKDSELWHMPNVTITPHISGAAIGYLERGVDILALNIERLKRGERLINQVDRQRGY